ncbi:MAG: L,D-transpeptidase family protein [Burkholderiales bacterium]|nr:L,D-transpeptidase family protein [Burkholderiales bacterium]
MRWLLLLIISAIAGVAAYAHFPAPELATDARADRVVVLKGERKLILMNGDRPLKEYRIALGRDPVGPKTQEGDGRTPEGQYVIDYRKRDSSFHRALHISYPDPADAAQASMRGVSPGGLIMVHGIRNGLGVAGRFHRLTDWTNGCIAVTNSEIEEIWRAVPDGTPIEIRP